MFLLKIVLISLLSIFATNLLYFFVSKIETNQFSFYIYKKNRMPNLKIKNIAYVSYAQARKEAEWHPLFYLNHQRWIRWWFFCFRKFLKSHI